MVSRYFDRIGHAREISISLFYVPVGGVMVEDIFLFLFLTLNMNCIRKKREKKLFGKL